MEKHLRKAIENLGPLFDICSSIISAMHVIRQRLKRSVEWKIIKARGRPTAWLRTGRDSRWTGYRLIHSRAPCYLTWGNKCLQTDRLRARLHHVLLGTLFFQELKNLILTYEFAQRNRDSVCVIETMCFSEHNYMAILWTYANRGTMPLLIGIYTWNQHWRCRPHGV